MLTDAERERLTRILGMLGSAHDGERAAAALHAEAFRRRHGMTWEELIRGPAPAWSRPWEQTRPQPEPEPAAPPSDPRAHAPSWAKPNTRPPDPAWTLHVPEQMKALLYVVGLIGGTILLGCL